MGRLVYSMMQSLDGYVSDTTGKFDWAEPDEAVHRFANELQRTIGTNLLGRRMHEMMSAWETLGTRDDEPDYIREFGELWRASDKIVYSSSLDSVDTARTRIERKFEPHVVQRMKDELADDISVSGPTLAATAIAAGLVDEYQLFVVPVVVGGGQRCMPDGVRLDLRLVDQRRFDNGTLYVSYQLVR
ncbi:MAG: dihydrofolate reductase family protein [Coriobacteriia bacterium]|nr:dihydrofolate reductase family protein [Coriobacteriia bacterium]